MNVAFRDRADRRIGDAWIRLTDVVVGVTVIGYLTQIVLFGPLRYYLSNVGLQPVWYIPDALGLACIPLFLIAHRQNRYQSLLFLAVIVVYLIEGYLISRSVTSVLSTFKALVPLFCGLLLNRRIIEARLVRCCFMALLTVAMLGILYSLEGKAPWSGTNFEGVSGTRAFKATQWVFGGSGEIRNFGFGGDQASTSSGMLTLFIFLSLRIRRLFAVISGLAVAVFIYMTTARTELLALFVYLLLWWRTDLRRMAQNQLVSQLALKASFVLALLVPIAVILFAANFDDHTIPKSLTSLWIRGSVTFLAPLDLLETFAPLAFIHGFGLGGFGFGFWQSPELAPFGVTVDNFFIYNFFAFGLPYLLFYAYQCWAMNSERDPYRVIIYVTLVVLGSFLRGWAGYDFMILFGFATAATFAGASRREAPIATRPVLAAG